MNTPDRDFTAGGRSQSALVELHKRCLHAAWDGNQKAVRGH